MSYQVLFQRAASWKGTPAARGMSVGVVSAGWGSLKVREGRSLELPGLQTLSDLLSPHSA